MKEVVAIGKNEQIKPEEHQGGAGQSWQEGADSERGVRRSNGAFVMEYTRQEYRD